MAISTQKLLPQSTSSGMRLSSSMIKSSSISVANRRSVGVGQGEVQDSGRKLIPIYSSLVRINELIENRSKEKSKNTVQQNRLEDKKKKKSQEEKLEMKKEKSIIGLPKIQNPFASFFDRLRNAIVLLFVGWLVNNFWEYIPKILEGVSNFIKTFEQIRSVLKPITDALGSALYQVTLSGTKMLGAITGAQIDENEKNLAVAINELDKKFSIVNALMAGIIIGDIFSAVADGLGLFRGRGSEAAAAAAGSMYGYRPEPLPEGVKPGTIEGRGITREQKRAARAAEKASKRVNAANIRRGSGGNVKIPKGIKGINFRGGLIGLLFLIPDLIDAGMLVSQGRGKDGLRLFLNAISSTLAGIGAASAVGGAAAALGITGVGLPAAIALAASSIGAGTLAGMGAYALSDAALTKMGLVDIDPETGKPYGYFLGGLVGGVRNFFTGKSAKVPSGSGKSQKTVQQFSSYSGTIKPISVDKNVADRIGSKVVGGFVEISSVLHGVGYVGPFAALGINIALGRDRFSKGTALSVAAGIGNLLGNPLTFAIYDFLNKAMPGLGNLVQKVTGKSFGIFISKFITEYLGNYLFKSLYPVVDFIKNIMKSTMAEARGIERGGGGNDGDRTPVNVPEGKDEKIKAALKFYKSKGFSDSGAAYMVGNLLQESGLRPDAVGDGGKAFGLAQWRIDAASGARWLGYQEWAKQNNKKINDFYAQLEYTIVEGEQYNAGLLMMKGNNISDHKKFIKGYEGYSVEGSRFGYAEDILRNLEKYGFGKKQGGKTTVNPDLKPNYASLSQSKPSSISAMAYPGVSQFASYDKPSVVYQPIRQIVYVPTSSPQPMSPPVFIGGGVNNIDYEIALTKAAL